TREQYEVKVPAQHLLLFFLEETRQKDSGLEALKNGLIMWAIYMLYWEIGIFCNLNLLSSAYLDFFKQRMWHYMKTQEVIYFIYSCYNQKAHDFPLPLKSEMLTGISGVSSSEQGAGGLV
ncbi:hypothetical protein ACJX0J_038428, partial [Zea mays]